MALDDMSHDVLSFLVVELPRPSAEALVVLVMAEILQ